MTKGANEILHRFTQIQSSQWSRSGNRVNCEVLHRHLQIERSQWLLPDGTLNYEALHRTMETYSGTPGGSTRARTGSAEGRTDACR